MPSSQKRDYSSHGHGHGQGHRHEDQFEWNPFNSWSQLLLYNPFHSMITIDRRDRIPHFEKTQNPFAEKNQIKPIAHRKLHTLWWWLLIQTRKQGEQSQSRKDARIRNETTEEQVTMPGHTHKPHIKPWQIQEASENVFHRNLKTGKVRKWKTETPMNLVKIIKSWYKPWMTNKSSENMRSKQQEWLRTRC